MEKRRHGSCRGKRKYLNNMARIIIIIILLFIPANYCVFILHNNIFPPSSLIVPIHLHCSGRVVHHQHHTQNIEHTLVPIDRELCPWFG